MADPQYTYPSDEEYLRQFIADHIKTRHTVEAADRHTLTCLSCARIAKVGDGHAADVLHKNRPGR